MAHKKNHKLTEAEIEVLLQEDDCNDITLDDELEEEQETSYFAASEHPYPAVKALLHY